MVHRVICISRQCCSPHMQLRLIALLAVFSVAATERPGIAPDNATEVEVRDCLAVAVKAVNEEDVEAFVECFPEPQHARRRRETGLLFVRHEMGMELKETHFLHKDDQRCDVAVRYRLLRTGRPTEIVSTVTLAKSEAGWRITKEKLLSAMEASYCGRDSDFIRVADLDPPPINPPQGNAQGPADDFSDILQPINGDLRIVPGGCANGRCGQ